MRVAGSIVVALLYVSFSGVGGAHGVAQEQPLRVLAAGDSFAAGEGLPGIQTGEGACQRALGLDAEGDTTPSTAWPVSVKQTFERATGDRHWTVDPFWFVACTGNLSTQFSDAPTQRGDGLSQLAEAQAGSGTDPWDVITLSFGGNDVGFSQILQDCVGLELTFDDLAAPESLLTGIGPALLNGSFAGCSLTEQQMKDRVQTTLPARLEHLYDQVAAQASPGGLVVVTGYPQLFADPSVWPIRDRLINRCNRVSEGDARAIRGATGFLNQTIGAAVTGAAERHPAQTWVFVDVNRIFEGTQPAESHGLCGPDEWINGFSFGGISQGDLRALDPGPLRDLIARLFNRSYHPNQAGHDGYSTITAGTINSSNWTPNALNPPLDIESLRSAPVPALCGHSEGRLVNGSLPGIGENEGFVAIDFDSRPPVQGDLDGDGTTEFVAVVDCSAGGVGHPNALLLFGPGPTLLDQFALADLLTDGLPDYEGDRSGLVELLVANERVETSWVAHRAGDIGAGPSLPVDVTLDVVDGAFTVVSIDRNDETDTLAGILAAANERDFVGLGAFRLGPSVAEDLVDAVELGGPLALDRCVGPLAQIEEPWAHDFVLRSCQLRQTDGLLAWAYLNYDYEGTWSLDSFEAEVFFGD